MGMRLLHLDLAELPWDFEEFDDHNNWLGFFLRELLFMHP